MATKPKQSLSAKIMAAIGDALAPPISDESGETPSASEVRKMKSAVAGSRARTGKTPAKKAARKPAIRAAKTRSKSAKKARA
jgi:hypothetical protein